MAEQKVAVITGASSGIGMETAKVFVAKGWHVIGTGRNPGRSAAAEAEIRAEVANGGKFDMLRGDMALMGDTMHIADEIKALTSRIDILFNNAGGVRDQRYVTSESCEETFSANHLAPFLLTRELLPLLRAAAAAGQPGDVRVIATSSLAYLTSQSLYWDDLQRLHGDFPATLAYCEAKLANVLFTRELNRRVSGEGIVAQAMIPGVVLTNFASHGDAAMQGYLKDAPGKTPAEVAETLVWMATAPEVGVNGGRVFYDMQEQNLAPHGADMEAAARLWEESEKILAGLGF